MARKDEVVRRFSRSGPHVRAVPGLAGTTLTWESDHEVPAEIGDVEAGNVVPVNPEIKEIQRPRDTRKASFAKVAWGRDVGDEK